MFDWLIEIPRVLLGVIGGLWTGLLGFLGMFLGI